jgi:Rrf2 family protein
MSPYCFEKPKQVRWSSPETRIWWQGKLMKLSRAATYAIHALAFMAGQKDNRLVTSCSIAQSEYVPERFLLKILKPLVSARILYSSKGPNGGYRLAKAPREISLLEIIEIVDGPISGQALFMAHLRNGGLDRKLGDICKQINVQTRRQLEKIRVSDLATSKR